MGEGCEEGGAFWLWSTTAERRVSLSRHIRSQEVGRAVKAGAQKPSLWFGAQACVMVLPQLGGILLLHYLHLENPSQTYLSLIS